MTVLIRFNIDNAAFRDHADDYDPDMVATVVRRVADDINREMNVRQGQPILNKHENIRDLNGNTVGTWAIKEAELL